jgi:hypothetical protein
MQVHEAIWATLLGRADFVSLVKSGNQDKLTNLDVARSAKSALQDSDVPDVRVAPAGFTFVSLDHTSGSAWTTHAWQIQLTTGKIISDRLDTINWMLIRAFAAWRTHIKALTWKGVEFTTVVRLKPGKATLDDHEANKGKKGWSTIWVVEADFMFRPADLLEVT